MCSISQPFRCLPSPSSIRQRKPLRGPRTTTSSFGTERRQAPTTESGRRPAHRLLSSLRCLSAPIWQAPAKQAVSPQMDWFKLRFAFRWYSALLKRCRPRGQSARRTQLLPRERALAPKNQRAQVSQGEICPKELHKTTPVSRKSGLEPERKPELGTSISICCRIGQQGAETCR